jgi:hypothetical protein
MAIQNRNLVLNSCVATVVAKQGRDAGVVSLGLGMPEALSQHGRPTSPGFTRFETIPAGQPLNVLATYRRLAKRVGITAANLPGMSVRSRDWALPITWATTTGSGRSAWTGGVSGRVGSERLARHHQHSGHDYPSHDRRDDQCEAAIGSTLGTNRGK